MKEGLKRLSDGRTTVDVRPLSEHVGRVERSDSYKKGSLLLSRDLTWSEAEEVLPDGTTRMGPYDLEIQYDALTGFEDDPCEDLSEALGLADPEALWDLLQVELDVDDNDALARAVSELLRAPKEIPSRDTGDRRRRADHAA